MNKTLSTTHGIIIIFDVRVYSASVWRRVFHSLTSNQTRVHKRAKKDKKLTTKIDDTKIHIFTA